MRVLDLIRSLHRDKDGAALIEFTLVAPLLILLMCGLGEFGQALRQYHVMQKGVTQAARFLARTPSAPCPAPDAAWSTYVAQAKNVAIYGGATSGTPLYKGWTNPSTVSIGAPACLANPRLNGQDLPKITVTATAPYQDLGMLSAIGLSSFNITVAHQELKVF